MLYHWKALWSSVVSFFISPYFKKCLSFFVHSLSLSLIHTHFVWLCLRWAVLPLLFPLSEIVWGQLAHVSSSPATACGLEIPPSQHFELHVSWLEKSMYTQILRLSAAKRIIHTYIHTSWMNLVQLYVEILICAYTFTLVTALDFTSMYYFLVGLPQPDKLCLVYISLYV